MTAAGATFLPSDVRPRLCGRSGGTRPPASRNHCWHATLHAAHAALPRKTKTPQPSPQRPFVHSSDQRDQLAADIIDHPGHSFSSIARSFLTTFPSTWPPPSTSSVGLHGVDNAHRAPRDPRRRFRTRTFPPRFPAIPSPVPMPSDPNSASPLNTTPLYTPAIAVTSVNSA